MTQTIDIDAILDRLTTAVENNGREKEHYFPLDIVDDVISAMVSRIRHRGAAAKDYERACVCLLGIDKSFAADLQAVAENFYEWEAKNAGLDDEY